MSRSGRKARLKATRSMSGGLLLLLSLVGLAVFTQQACPSSQPPIHLNPNMDDQPKYLPQSPSSFFYNGAAMQLPVEGTVARGEGLLPPEFYTGRSPWGFYVQSPLEPTPELLSRGASRFQIYCSPCHGVEARGGGTVATRTGVEVPRLRTGAAATMADGQIFQIVSRGRGLMPSYVFALPPEDRWAIVAQLRRWQREDQ